MAIKNIYPFDTYSYKILKFYFDEDIKRNHSASANLTVLPDK